MLVYVAGPYSASTKEGVEKNIQLARQSAIKLWEVGHVVFCPHLNTAYFDEDCNLTNEDFIERDLLVLARCDAVYVLDGWGDSKGTKIELTKAGELGIPIFQHDRVPPLHETEVKYPLQTKRFAEILGKLYRAHLNKTLDYGPTSIPGLGQYGVAVRIWDKIYRILNLLGFNIEAKFNSLSARKNSKNELLKDAWLDLVICGIIGLLNSEDCWGK